MRYKCDRSSFWDKLLRNYILRKIVVELHLEELQKQFMINSWLKVFEVQMRQIIILRQIVAELHFEKNCCGTTSWGTTKAIHDKFLIKSIWGTNATDHHFETNCCGTTFWGKLLRNYILRKIVVELHQNLTELMIVVELHLVELHQNLTELRNWRGTTIYKLAYFN